LEKETNLLFISISWKLQSVFSPPLENVASFLYRKLSVALNFLLMLFSHALSHHSVTRTNFLTRSRTHPTIAGSRNPRGSTRPTQDSAVACHRQQLTWTVSLHPGPD